MYSQNKVSELIQRLVWYFEGFFNGLLCFYFVQGPPGTGKSFVGVALVHLLLSMNVPQNYGPILVTDSFFL